MSRALIEKVLLDLISYCWRKSWQGFDPYDALNSPFLTFMSMNTSLGRMICTQFVKRFPLNIRKVLWIKEGINPKGLGLFVSSLVNMYRKTGDEAFRQEAQSLLTTLLSLATPGYGGYCWGYNFPWQSRAFYIPAGTPTVVATSYIANSFLDAYEVFKEGEYLKAARNSCEFILRDIKRTDFGGALCFSYSPMDESQVFNVTVLGAVLLSRVYSLTGESELLKVAEKGINFIVNHQNDDGSWWYGLAENQRWIDNFHSGFILECLMDYIGQSQNAAPLSALKKGFQFYRSHLFLDDGAAKYYPESLFPIDIHSLAQGIITFVKLKDLDPAALGFAEKIAEWAVSHMYCGEGYFYFQKSRFYTNRIPYIRWSQAWMAKALSILLNAAN